VYSERAGTVPFIVSPMNLPEFHTQHVFFASGSEDDGLLFQQAIAELPYLVHRSIAKSDEDALKVLVELPEIPDLIILDLDLTNKSGLECLFEIKANKKFESLPVVVYGTTSYPAVINELYQGGAHLYIHKCERSGLKTMIQHVLSVNWKEKIAQPPREEFVFKI
jgi:response regulator RpfG family c-di-GMP phosphodiesterase